METLIAFVVVIFVLYLWAWSMDRLVDWYWNKMVEANDQRIAHKEKETEIKPAGDKEIFPEDPGFQAWMSKASLDNHERLDTPCLGCKEKPAPRKVLPDV
jgi:hypothetical protein